MSRTLTAPDRSPSADWDESSAARAAMVTEQLAGRGVRDPRVLAAMGRVPRHRFVPEAMRSAALAYGDHPLAIGEEQTISQPYIVARMSELAALAPGDKVLEVGTGSGYQTAVLAELGARVWTIEILEPLARRARTLLDELGYPVAARTGDGYRGWPEAAPFAAILLTAAPPAIPEPLQQQLEAGGRLVAPVGRDDQQLVVLTRSATGFEQRTVIPVRFVPMTGEAQGDPATTRR